jgi:hypothetical protein
MARKPDPWNLDLAGIAQKIAEGTFSAWDLDLLPQRDATFTAGPGQWFFESPFSDTMTADPAGMVTAHSLTIGMHGLFSVEGRSLLLYVGPREIVVAEGR